MFSVIGLGGASGVAAQSTRKTTLNAAALTDAEAVAGLAFTPAQSEFMVDGVQANLERYAALRALKMPNEVAPSYYFDPVAPGLDADVADAELPLRVTRQTIPTVPSDLEQLAF